MNHQYCQHKVLQNNMILPNQTTKTLLAITMAMIQGTTMMIVLVQEVFLLKTLELQLRTTCHHPILPSSDILVTPPAALDPYSASIPSAHLQAIFNRGHQAAHTIGAACLTALRQGVSQGNDVAFHIGNRVIRISGALASFLLRNPHVLISLLQITIMPHNTEEGKWKYQIG